MMTARLFALFACLGVAPTASAPVNASPSAAQAEAYRKALPGAATFVSKAIPPAMVAPSDRDNLTYVEAYAQNGNLVGYLRDFTGPVSPAEACPCNPLNLTLVFGPDKQLITLTAPAPLQKYGHEAMTADEQDRLIELAKRPPDALMRVRRVEDVVDVTTGATRLELAPVVVPRAGLSTRRIAGLVRETTDILQGAPVGRDRQRLYDLLNQKISGAALAHQLAAIMPSLETDELRLQAYGYLLNSYLASQPDSTTNDETVEDRLLNPGLSRQTAGPAIAHACYELADRSLRLSLVDKGITLLSKPDAPPVPNELMQLLRGTRRFVAGDMRGAVAPLQNASRKMSVLMNPGLHLRLGQALVATSKADSACPIGKALYAEHPLMPGVKELLGSCAGPGKSPTDVQHEAEATARARFLAKARPAAPVVGPLSVESDDGTPVELSLGQPNTITVAMFFGCWCPHCRVELPRVKDFVQALNARDDLRTRVRVVGVRTAVEKDAEPYSSFVQQFAPNFPVYADPTMSLAFSLFAKTVGIPAALPTTAVLDETGAVRFLLEPGDWRDTQSELMWAVEKLLKSK